MTTARYQRSPEAARMARARQAAGLTTREAAIRLGVSPAMVSLWECDRHKPREWAVARLAELYEVPVSYLMFGGDDMPVAWKEHVAELARAVTPKQRQSALRALNLMMAGQDG